MRFFMGLRHPQSRLPEVQYAPGPALLRLLSLVQEDHSSLNSKIFNRHASTNSFQLMPPIGFRFLARNQPQLFKNTKYGPLVVKTKTGSQSLWHESSQKNLPDRRSKQGNVSFNVQHLFCFFHAISSATTSPRCPRHHWPTSPTCAGSYWTTTSCRV